MRDYVTIYSNETDLTRQSWTFWYGPRGMVLDAWLSESRASKRHKWRSDRVKGEVWMRLMGRNNRVERPEPPECVVASALRSFAASLVYNGGHA